MAELPQIVATCICPPIPDRRWDWQAYRYGYEPGCLIGYGPTKEAAIADLVEQEQELGDNERSQPC